MEYISYHSTDYKNLESKINKYILVRHGVDDIHKNKKANIIDQAENEIYHRKCYDIPQERLNDILEKMKIMSIDNQGLYCFSERQVEEENGIFIDIDSYNDENKRKYKDQDLKDILDDYMEILVSDYMENIEDEVFVHAFIMEKKELVYNEKMNKYKEGYHIIIPDLYLKKIVRRNILFELKNNNDDIDVATAGNPSMFYGNVKSKDLKMRDKYEIKSQKEIRIYNKRNKNKFEINEYNIKESANQQEYNIIKELSLTIEGDILKNKKIVIKEDLIKELEECEIIEIDDINKINVNSMEELRKNDLEANYLYELLDLLDEKYYNERDFWFKILCGIYDTSIKSKNNYDIIAEWFSKKSAKYNEEDFNTQWFDIKTRRGSQRTPITLGSVKHYAYLSNKKKYIDIIENNDVYMIKKEINTNLDELQHYTVARILHNILGKYIAYNQSDTNTGGTWYTYIDDKNMKLFSEDGEMYKWVREGQIPITLSIYLSELLTKRLDKIIDEFNIQIGKMPTQNSKDTADLASLKEKLKHVKKTRIKFGDSGYKTSVLKECKTLFLDKLFIKKLDKNKKLLGVKNGILILPEIGHDIILLSDYSNEYFVQSFTNINYIKYDENNVYIKRLMVILSDIIPETDALEYILTYLSTSISNDSKEPLILFLRGGGCNGKSTILELMLNVLGENYSKKLCLGLLTDSRESSQNANSAYMELKDARFGYFSEPDKAEKINTGRLKEILGNEKLTGRGLYKNQENFENKCNLIAASNYDFVISASDYGIWRRIMYYECKVKFIDKPNPNNPFERKKVKGLIENVIKDDLYLEAFLSILTHYYLKYINIYDKDLSNISSQTMQKEITNYRNRQDSLHKFIKEKVLIDDNNYITLEDFSLKYRDWLMTVSGFTFSKSITTIEEIVNILESSDLGYLIKTCPETLIKYFSNIRLKSDIDIFKNIK
tara:strand:+ start:2730 stop:5567 length:2838 start_codon:yes stop_codon:yes gene_type:complete